MAHSFELRRTNFHPSKSAALSASDFERIAAAHSQQLDALEIEEKVDLLLENFAELEQALMSLSLRHSIFISDTDGIARGARELANRRLANLLMAGRLYRDQIPQNLRSLAGAAEDPAQRMKEWTQTEYDSNLGYRVVEELRNHTQHRGLPSHGITFSETRMPGESVRKFRHTVAPYLSLDSLSARGFKKKLLGELESSELLRGSEVLLMPLIRQYIDAIGRIHVEVRKLASKGVGDADNVIAEFLARAKAAIGDGCAAFQVNEDGSVHLRYPLSTYLLDGRKHLERKNRSWRVSDTFASS